MDSLTLIEIEHKIIYGRILALGALAKDRENFSEWYGRLEENLFLRDQIRNLAQEKGDKK